MKLAAAALLTLAAYTGPVDPEISRWFNSLTDREGRSCCSIADGRVLKSDEYRVAGDFWEVVVNGAWVRVPPDKVLDRVPNPMGAPVLFQNPAGHIYCFVRAESY